MLKAILRLALKPIGYTAVSSPSGTKIVKRNKEKLIYLHEYAGGYDEYRDSQIFHNRRKIDKIWADEGTLGVIADSIKSTLGEVRNGCCHGARNGFEVEWLADRLKADVIGTDISDTATQFKNMVVWDFHTENPDWIGKFDFIYTNSLDQAMKPDVALATWAGQLRRSGRIYIEHTMSHSASGASEMDPFGAHPMCMPYLFHKWGKGRYRLADIIEGTAKTNNGKEAWIFVLSRDDDPGQSADLAGSGPQAAPDA